MSTRKTYKRNGYRTRRQTARRTYYSPRYERKAYAPLPRAAPAKKVNDNVLGTVGGAIGSAYGPVGTVLGTVGGSLLGDFLGIGDYTEMPNSSHNISTVETNSLIKDRLPKQLPPFMNGKEPYIIVHHREYCFDVLSHIGFVGVVANINPTDTKLFPWLKNVAMNYEKYKVLGMVVEYVSLSGESSSLTVPTLGSVMMAHQTNNYDPVFPDKQHMLNHRGAISSSPNKNMMLGIECDPEYLFAENKFIRHADQIVGGDNRVYDFGSVSVFCEGQNQIGSIIGEIWCSYQIALINPRVNTSAFETPEFLSPSDINEKKKNKIEEDYVISSGKSSKTHSRAHSPRR
ncbi:capsid protein [Crucivirus-88]|nr:capsid protein [Crucivirus-88]